MKRQVRKLRLLMYAACVIFPVCGILQICQETPSAASKIDSIYFTNVEQYYTLKKGESKALKYSVEPDDAKKSKVKWRTSNRSVVTVSKKGVIKGMKKGKAKITVCATDGSKKECSLTVYVGQKVSAVTLKNTEQPSSITCGTKLSFSAEITPANASCKKLEWSSSDEEVAEVSESGRVTGVSPGSAVIRVSACDGTGKSDSITVTVVDLIFVPTVPEKAMRYS